MPQLDQTTDNVRSQDYPTSNSQIRCLTAPASLIRAGERAIQASRDRETLLKAARNSEGVGIEPHRRKPSPLAGYKSAAPTKMRDAFRYFLLPN